MRRRLCWVIGLALGAIILGGSLAWTRAGDDDEKEREGKLSIEQVPAAVKATILKQAGKSKIEEIEQVTKGGKKLYEVEWIQDGKEVEITVAPNGKVLSREVEGDDEDEDEDEADDDDGDEDEDEDEADDDDEDEDEDEADDDEDEDEDEADDEEDEDEDEAEGKEVEREVTEADVPAAALAALKDLAAGAKITEFAEEIEHGQTFYEGSWKARSGGKMDVLVTPAGALVEIEEGVGADQVPAAVLKAARKAAGKRAELGFEKKTMILYEIKFRRGDRRHELLLTPDGRRVEEEVEKVRKGGEEDEDDEDDNDKDDNDDDNNNDDA